MCSCAEAIPQQDYGPVEVITSGSVCCPLLVSTPPLFIWTGTELRVTQLQLQLILLMWSKHTHTHTDVESYLSCYYEPVRTSCCSLELAFPSVLIKSAGGTPIETLLSLLIVCILAYQTITDLIPLFPTQSAFLLTLQCLLFTV